MSNDFYFQYRGSFIGNGAANLLASWSSNIYYSKAEIPVTGSLSIPLSYLGPHLTIQYSRMRNFKYIYIYTPKKR